MANMTIELDGKTYDFDLEDVDILQAKAIKTATGGMTIMAWERALEDADPDALQCLWWLILVQNGGNPRSDPTKVNVKIVKLAKAFKAAQADKKARDEAEAKEANPTGEMEPAETGSSS